ncbi:MAG: hypothetical protein C5B57_07420 [Blastocatellia bacterium]|nr:MAG: hypothetical protein C5B57_07420 [Blastocatellia bacterium]
MPRRSFLTVAFVFVLVCFPSSAAAQATGTITGLITDPSGAVVPGVTVEAINRSTAQSRTTVTAADGFYTIPLLSPDTYQVKAGLAGFRTSVRNGIDVPVNESVRVDFTLQLGDLSEQLTVSATTALVETKKATLGIVVDQRKIVDLPLNGRNFTQLGTLTPGVVAPPIALGGQNGNATSGGGIGNTTGGFNVNGMRNQSNNFLLDGTSNNDLFNTGFVLRPPPDAIQEFKILTHSYDAEYGRNVGSVVNVATKSGTNDWRGTLWEFNRSDVLQAKNFFATSKPTLKQNQFGGALGGPLVKNGVFVFGYFEGFRNTEGQTDTRTVLSAAERAGDFSGSAAIRDPLTGVAFSGNVIPSSRIDSIAAKLLNDYIPVPTSSANRVVRSPDISDTRGQFGLRVDYRARANHNLLARYMFSHTRSVNPLGSSNFAPSDNASAATVSDVMGSDTWIARDNTINLLRVSVNRINAEPTRSSGLNPRDLGFAYSGSQAASSGLPFVLIQGFFTTGDSQQQFARRVNDVFAITDDVAWVAGSHSFKFGGEARRDQITASYIFDPNGDYTFSGQYTGNAAADFLLGFPVLFRQATGDPNLEGSSWAFAVYGQDEFRLGPRMTVNYGLRYEITQPFVESRNRLNAFHPGQQSTVFPTAPLGLVYPGDKGVPRGTYPTDINNLAPRLAAVFDPRGNGRTSIRAAWGLFYDTLPAQGDFFQSGVVASPFQSLTEVTFPLQQTTSPFANPLQGVTGSGLFPASLIFVGWGPEFATPVTHHFNLSLQRQVGDYWGLEIGYVGTRASHLPIFMEINPTLPILSPAPAIGPRVYPAFSLLRPTFSVARSWYDSLQTSARMRPWHGLTGLASYTLGHGMDHVSALNVGSEPRPMLPAVIGDDAAIESALEREKGDSLFDVRHRFVVSFSYELPTYRAGSAATRLAFGGWQLNGIIQGQTGFPLTIVEPNNVSLTSLTNRPNMVCDPNAGAARTTAEWFKTSCFRRLTLPADAGQIGNEPRNAVRGPGFNRVDLSLFKNVALAGDQQLQLRVEAFNAFNSVRFNLPGNQIGSPTFGQITSADDGRIVQLGVKYMF